jgi:Putative 2OG-Fe(II) oxygenase
MTSRYWVQTVTDLYPSISQRESISLASDLTNEAIRLYKCGLFELALETLLEVEKNFPYFTPAIAWLPPVLDALDDVVALKEFYDYSRSIKILDINDLISSKGDYLPLAVAKSLNGYQRYVPGTQSMPLFNSKINGDVDDPGNNILGELKCVVGASFNEYAVSNKFRSSGVIPVDWCKLSMWAIKVLQGGSIGPHYHPASWLSAVFYPPPLCKGGSLEDAGGYLEFGHVPPEMGKLKHPQIYRLEPISGTVVIFPAYVGHAVTTVKSIAGRTSLAFDLRACGFVTLF